MFEEVLSKQAKSSLALLAKSGLLKNAYLAGGTALALQIGHRISVDLDFFTQKKFDEKIFAQRLAALPVNFQLEQLNWRTILGYIAGTKFSLFFYNYPLLSQPSEFLKINIIGVRDIAPMKLAAISDRGTKRDFVDLYFITAVEKVFSLWEVFDLYNKKYKVLQQNKLHLLKSLTYFKDAEQDVMPEMIKKVGWYEVKEFFESEVKSLARRII